MPFEVFRRHQRKMLAMLAILAMFSFVLADSLPRLFGTDYSGPDVEGVEIVELPAAETAICGVHLGSMERIPDSWAALHEEIIARGFVPSGPCRELYVRAVSEDQSDWVTELQQPVTQG